MATFRFSLILSILVSLACAPGETATNSSGPPPEVALIQHIQIEHVTPARDFVGPIPTKLEWTAAAGVESYSVSVENEIEIPVFDHDGIITTSVPWPKEVRIDPGTYYWRIIGLKGGKVIADSGRAAFVVREP